MRTPLAILPALALPTTVHASHTSFRRFNNFCTTGAFVSCASVSVRIVALSNGGTALTITLQNLQGTNPHDNNPGSLLTGIDVLFHGFTSDLENNDDELPYWTDSVAGTNTIGTPFFDRWWSGYGAALNMLGVDSGIAGCNPPILQPTPWGDTTPLGYYQTCASAGAPGVITMTFMTDQHLQWSVGNMSVGWDFNNGSRMQRCVPGVNCFAATVTPEPQTIALLATGLVMVGLVARKAGESQSSGG